MYRTLNGDLLFPNVACLRFLQSPIALDGPGTVRLPDNTLTRCHEMFGRQNTSVLISVPPAVPREIVIAGDEPWAKSRIC